MSDTEQKPYLVFPSVVAPIILSCLAVYLGFTRDYWLFASIPFVVLGSICAAPNLNMADGCLAMLAIIIGIGIAVFLSPTLGGAISMGSLAGWIGGVIEKTIRMRPA